MSPIGYTILDTNVRAGRHEIDIVAEHQGTLVFAEVRARRGHRMGTPQESITSRKQESMLAAAHRYIESTGDWDREWRIDVVAVEFDRLDRISELTVLQNAVEL